MVGEAPGDRQGREWEGGGREENGWQRWRNGVSKGKSTVGERLGGEEREVEELGSKMR